MKSPPLISVVVNSWNEADNLNKCLKSVSGFANEIVVVDMHSTDDTKKVATSYGAKIYPYRRTRVVEPARNFALSKAKGKWILLLDPDEYINQSLKKELLKITKRSDVSFVKIPRKNIIFGKWLRHTHMWPDYLIRFFRNGAVTWKNEIHSQPVTHGNGITLLDSEKLAIRHRNYKSVTDFIYRAIRYSGVQADELKNNSYKLKTSDFILKPIQEFNSRFFASEGFKDGFHGFVFSLLQAIAIAFIYIRLWEKQGTKDKALSKESFVSASQETIYEYSYWFTQFFNQEYKAGILKRLFVKIRLYLDRLTKNF